MKNRKIFTITIAVIALMAGAMLVCSKAIEKAWTTPENTENNLTANSDNITAGETNFDYPYTMVTPEVLLSLGDDYVDNLVEADWGYKDSIPFQQVANIAGELVKDIYGHTARQKEPVFILLRDEPNRGAPKIDPLPDEYKHLELSFVKGGDFYHEITYYGTLSPYTGQVLEFHWYDPDGFYHGNDEYDLKHYKLTDEQAHQAFDNEIRLLFDMFGNTDEIVNINYRNTEKPEVDDYTSDYMFNVYSSDGNLHKFRFYKKTKLLSSYQSDTLFRLFFKMDSEVIE